LLDFSFLKSINWVHSIRHPLGRGGWSRVRVLFLSFNLAAESVTWVSKSNGGTDSGTGPHACSAGDLRGHSGRNRLTMIITHSWLCLNRVWDEYLDGYAWRIRDATYCEL
jgi:hypothetical protein